MGEPLKLWEPLSITKVQPWQQLLLPWPKHWQVPPSTPRVEPWKQFLPAWPHLWLVPPLSPALGPPMGESLRLWEPLSSSRVQPW